VIEQMIFLGFSKVCRLFIRFYWYPPSVFVFVCGTCNRSDQRNYRYKSSLLVLGMWRIWLRITTSSIGQMWSVPSELSSLGMSPPFSRSLLTSSILGNIYSRVFGGTAFTSMVTGVLFLVPVSHFFSSILLDLSFRFSV